MAFDFFRSGKAGEQSEEEAGKRLEEEAKAVKLQGDPVGPMRTGILFLLIGLGGFLAWAAWAPLDEGVPAPGAIVIESQRKPVQHLTGGIVRQVHVAEAQAVKAGDVLIELDDARLRAEQQAVKGQYYGALALQARLDAERLGRKEVQFPAVLLDAVKSDESAASRIVLQEQLFLSRRDALQSELRALDDAIAGLESQRHGLEARLSGRRQQLELVRQQLVGSRGLAAEGYLPRNRLLEEERLAVDLESQIADLIAGLASNQNSVAEMRSRRLARINDFRQRVDAELADVSRDIPAYAERLTAVSLDLDRARLLAPVDGFVVGLQVQSVGAVVAPGAKIMDIVPANEKTMLDVQIPPHLVDSVRPGLIADIRLHAFHDAPQFVIEGRLLSISADRLTDPVSHQPFFLGRIEVLPETLKHLEGRELVPGMSAEVVIKTGERSLLTYLLQPLLRRVSTSMTEY